MLELYGDEMRWMGENTTVDFISYFRSKMS